MPSPSEVGIAAADSDENDVRGGVEGAIDEALGFKYVSRGVETSGGGKGTEGSINAGEVAAPAAAPADAAGAADAADAAATLAPPHPVAVLSCRPTGVLTLAWWACCWWLLIDRAGS